MYERRKKSPNYRLMSAICNLSMCLKILCAVVCLITPALALAQDDALHIVPERIETSAPVEKALAQQKGSTVTTLEGKGSSVAITYHASEPIEIFLAPLGAQDRYNIDDFLHFVLPASPKRTALVEFTGSPGWSPGNRKYLLNILVRSEGVEAGFFGVEFQPASTRAIIVTAFRHFFTPEPYTPSSYHALHGQRIFGFPAAVLAGIVALIATGVAVLIAYVRQRPLLLTALTVLTGALLFFQLRPAIDLLRFTAQHVQEYYGQSTFDEAGSIHAVARRIRSMPSASKVFVCRDGTNFKEKLLRYFVYPAIVSAEESAASDSVMAVVMNKQKWNFTPRESAKAEQKGALGTLECEDIKINAMFLERFTDGSMLFSIPFEPT